MRIPTLDRKGSKDGFESIMWDLGSIHNYICTVHAEYMKFPRRLAKKRSVTILEGKEIIVQGF